MQRPGVIGIACLLVGCGTTPQGLDPSGERPASPMRDDAPTRRASPVEPSDLGPPLELTGYRAISLGDYLGCAIGNDGSLWCWGQGRFVPVQLPGAWSTVSAGGVESCAISTSGALYCWPGNADPARVGAAVGWQQVSAGGQHACALGDGGALWCWGDNASGQVGDGSNDLSASSPRALGAGWLAVAAGGTHTCGLQLDGSLWCWGDNQRSQLGDGTQSQRRAPVRIGGAHYLQVAAGQDSTCAIALDGALWCWGGVSGPAQPTRVGSDVGWTHVDLQRDHACALRDDGAIRCWGANDWGQLGDGTSLPSTTPVAVQSAFGFEAVAVGRDATCGLQQGTLSCWGHNQVGQLAIGAPNKYQPVRIGSGTFTAVDAAAGSTCARATSGQLACWGDNSNGALGVGDQSWESEPRAIADVLNWTAFSGGDQHRCAVRGGTTLWCWGAGDAGQLGVTSAQPRLSPGLVAIGGPISNVSAAGRYACARLLDHSLRCWGQGPGDTLPFDGVGWTVPGTYQRISTGDRHMCAIATDGALWCWGDNDHGQLGAASLEKTGTEPALAAAGYDYIDVAVGAAHTCALHADGTLNCWGAGGQGQLGDGALADHPEPSLVGNASGPFAAVFAGGDHTCAIAQDRSLWCWGSDDQGQIGDGLEVAGAHATPARVGTEQDWLSVAVGGTHTCGLRGGGSLWCWGNNSSGQIGDGTAFRKRPIQ